MKTTPAVIETNENGRADSRPILSFTGYARHHKLEVRVGASLVHLTVDQYHLLAQFALKRRQSTTGRVSARDVCATDEQHFRMMVHRLRRAIDASLGVGAGERLIQNGMPGDYQLNVAPSDIYADGSCGDLPAGVTCVDLTAFPASP